MKTNTVYGHDGPNAPFRAMVEHGLEHGSAMLKCAMEKLKKQLPAIINHVQVRF